jgi:NitT/TauT family transport system substrate-binding protein
LFYAPFYATQTLGFYDREGVDVELRPSPAPAAAAPDLLDGMIDLSWGGPMRVMKGREDNPNSPLVCFCEVVARDPFFLVGRSDPSAFRLTDLRGLRIGTVSEVPTPWLCLQQDLRDAGVDPDGLERLTDRTMANNLEALRKGDLDVAQLFEPYVSTALASGVGEILYAASARGPAVYTTFLATRDGIARNRSAFAAMVRAVRRMQAWLQEHGADELAAAVGPFYPGVAADLLASSLRRYHQAGLWAIRPEVSRQGFARLAASLLSGGFVSRLYSYDDCVDESLC